MQISKRIILLFIGILAPTFLLITLFNQFAPALADSPVALETHPKWDEALTQEVRGAALTDLDSVPEPHSRLANSDQRYNYILHLREQADLSAMGPETGRSAPVVTYLQDIATASQRPLQQAIDELSALGHINSTQSLWIINAIVVETDLAALQSLSARDDVARVTLNAARDLIPELDITVSPPPTSITWGLGRIGADKVWYGLGVDGSGVTVASLDSGVDWTHPALNGSYRGRGGNHEGNWFDASTDAFTTPVDYIGHGTHVMGTFVGQYGIGVAPGAEWISVKIVDSVGAIRDSYVHLAFQWILAPNGDPDLAPDIVNNSWGNSAPAFAGFWPDVAAIHAAGILTPFAAGNFGPAPSSITSPASYTNTLAIGATGPFDELAYFSSRGPSPFTNDFKPAVVAPGAHVLSTLPDGGYGYNNGTSMAAPHAAGALALLLAANPALSASEATYIMTSTAGFIGSGEIPNNSFGWGIIDAVAMVENDVPHGILTGIISAEGEPLTNAVVTVTTAAGYPLTYTVDLNGRYTAYLQAGSYSIEAQQFGYNTGSVNSLIVTTGTTTQRDFNLWRLPGGTVSGQLTGDEGVDLSGFALTALGTEQTVLSNVAGQYEMWLPAGQYQLQLFRSGFKIAVRDITINSNGAIVADFNPQPGPTVLLINGNQWLYDPHINPYRQSLLDNNLAFDEWTILNPFSDTPPLGLLRQYDVVVWASPRFSPSYFDFSAQLVISDYLGLGGNLLVSGQDIANIEGQGIFGSFWFQRRMGADFQKDAAPPYTLTGQFETDFVGLNFSLNGADSDQNQLYPDAVSLRDGRLARPLLRYADGSIAAVGSGECQPHSLIYLGFGLEGVTGQANRAALVERSLAQFATPAPAYGVEFAATPVDDFVVAGESRRYDLPFYNLGEFITDTFNISIEDAIWPTSIVTETVTVGPCKVARTAINVTVPADIPLGITQTMTVRVSSAANPSVYDTITIHHETPTGEVLIIDDDRWYDFEWVFGEGLAEKGISYDIWDIGWDDDVRGSPSLELLNAYPFVIWYTGYDWFRPVNPAELLTITHYLEDGGRLFLNSQDFLYHHADENFVSRYLGLLDYQEMVTPTVAFAGRANPTFMQLTGQYPLDYGPYQNYSDGLVPAPDTTVMLRHNGGAPAGTAYSNGHWRTVFWGTPLETLPANVQAAAIQDNLSWLSDLGDSTFVVSEPNGDWSLGTRHSFTLTLHNNATVANVITLTNPLPAEFNLLTTTLSSGAIYDLSSHTISWQGSLATGGAAEISYEVELNTPLADGQPLSNVADLRYSRHQIPVRRVAVAWPGEIDVAQTTFTLAPATLTPPGGVFTTGLRLWLTEPAGSISGSMLIPAGIYPVTGSLDASWGDIELVGRRVNWQAENVPATPISLTLAYTTTVHLNQHWLPFTWQIEIEKGYPHVWQTILKLNPFRTFLPIFANS